MCGSISLHCCTSTADADSSQCQVRTVVGATLKNMSMCCAETGVLYSVSLPLCIKCDVTAGLPIHIIIIGISLVIIIYLFMVVVVVVTGPLANIGDHVHRL